LQSLWQSFCRASYGSFVQSPRRALVEHNVLKFVTCVLQVDTARKFFSNQLKAGLAKFEIQDPKIVGSIIKRPPKSTFSLRSNHAAVIIFLATWNLTKTRPQGHLALQELIFLSWCCNAPIEKCRFGVILVFLASLSRFRFDYPPSLALCMT